MAFLRLLLLCLSFILPGTLWADCAAWPDWVSFDEQFISPGGRVIDPGSPDQRTVSEAQAYALFFALIANQPERFEVILEWTSNNLAGGDLTSRLPAWLWGRMEDGNWGVIDDNSAADADLWLAYALIQAGRLWQSRRYQALGLLLSRQILRQETKMINGLGLSILPGARGFELSATRWRLNPSYVPLFVLRGLADADPNQGWEDAVEAAQALLQHSSAQGFVPNWVIFSSEEGFANDPKDQDAMAYDAIRVYLWAGLMPPEDPLRNALLSQLAGMARWTMQHGFPPASSPPTTPPNAGPVSFSWALLPLLSALKQTQALEEQLLRVDARPLAADAYYGQALRLFSKAWLEQRYQFTPAGLLRPRWLDECS